MNPRIISFYDGLAPAFDAEQDSHGFLRETERRAVQTVLDRLCLPTMRVLEIGAGTGRFTERIAPLVGSVTAIDCSSGMLDRLRQRIADKGIENVEVVKGDFLTHPLEPGFDLIVCFSAIEYFSDKTAFFAKARSLAAANASLLLTTARTSFIRFWGQVGNYVRQGILLQTYSIREMRRLLVQNGFQPREITDHCLKTPLTKGILLLVHASTANQGLAKDTD